MRTHLLATTGVAALLAAMPTHAQTMTAGVSNRRLRPPPRRLMAVFILAALGLAWPQVVRAQTLTPTIPNAVATASSNLQSAIQTGGDVPGALGSYNAAVSTAASPFNLVNVPLAGPITTLQSVGSQALIIFAQPPGTLTFSGSGRVTIGSGGGFFLGSGATSL